MDRSLSEQGLLETPSYSSLPAVSEGASVPSVSAATAPVSTIGSAAPPLPTAPPPPSTSSALMQLQPQSLNEQSHYSLYPQQQPVASAASIVEATSGGVNIGQLDPLSAHRDSVMPGRRFLWPSVFLFNQDLFHLFFQCIVCQDFIHIQIHRSKAFCLLISVYACV